MFENLKRGWDILKELHILYQVVGLAVAVLLPGFIAISSWAEKLPGPVTATLFLVGVAAILLIITTILSLGQMGKKDSKADFTSWDQVSEFALFHAAWLWAEKEPKSPVQGSPQYGYFLMLTEAIRTKELNTVVDVSTLSSVHGRRFSPATHVTINRDELRGFAEKRGMRPKFLYPEDR